MITDLWLKAFVVSNSLKVSDKARKSTRLHASLTPEDTSEKHYPFRPAWHTRRRYPAFLCWCGLCENNGTGKSGSRTPSPSCYEAHFHYTSASLQVQCKFIQIDSVQCFMQWMRHSCCTLNISDKGTTVNCIDFTKQLVLSESVLSSKITGVVVVKWNPELPVFLLLW